MPPEDDDELVDVALDSDPSVVTKPAMEASDDDFMEDRAWCPRVSLLLGCEITTVSLALVVGILSIFEHTQQTTLTVEHWVWITLLYLVFVFLLRPTVWAVSVGHAMDEVFPGGNYPLHMRLVRQVTVGICWDFLLALVSFSLIFTFYLQRSEAQLREFDLYRHDTALSIDVRLPVAWGNCMNFVTFAMMSNIVSFTNLFFLQVVITHRSRHAMNSL